MEELKCPVCPSGNPVGTRMCLTCGYPLAGVEPTPVAVQEIGSEPSSPVAAGAAGLTCASCGDVGQNPAECEYCFHPRSQPSMRLEFGWTTVSPAAGQEILIGRDNASLPRLAQFSNVSRRHASLELQDGALTMTDLDSTNGTYVNGQLLEPRQPHRMKPGDVVRFGRDLEARVRSDETGPT